MMALRRLTESRGTHTTPEQVAAIAASYYENTIQHKPDEEKRAFSSTRRRAGWMYMRFGHRSTTR